MMLRKFVCEDAVEFKVVGLTISVILLLPCVKVEVELGVIEIVSDGVTSVRLRCVSEVEIGKLVLSVVETTSMVLATVGLLKVGSGSFTSLVVL